MRKKSKALVKRQKNTQFFLLLVLIGLEILAGLYVWSTSKPSVNQGFIVKNGQSWILVWNNSDQSRQTKHYTYLNEALEFAKEKLGLGIGPNPFALSSLEQVWTREEAGRKMIFWKTDNMPMPGRLTFHRPFEATVFEKAIRFGAYSPSPLGHAISLIRQETN